MFASMFFAKLLILDEEDDDTRDGGDFFFTRLLVFELETRDTDASMFFAKLLMFEFEFELATRVKGFLRMWSFNCSHISFLEPDTRIP